MRMYAFYIDAYNQRAKAWDNYTREYLIKIDHACKTFIELSELEQIIKETKSLEELKSKLYDENRRK